MSFQIVQLTDSNNNSILKIANDTTEAAIYLNLGASLQKLKLRGELLIDDMSPLTYTQTFASSILFPFASRVKDGKYTFKGTEYQLEKNNVEEGNAIHGFVHDKTFNVVRQNLSKNSASVVLEYKEERLTKGFPFTYKIQLKYVLTNESLDLHVTILNTSTESFPFTLGWHPYFLSSDLNNSFLKFDSNKCVVFDDRMITSDTVEIKNERIFELKNKELEDCFFLNSNKVVFITPRFKLQMQSSEENDFLQIYTPPKENTIAIEPTTGISDSFNNKIGLRTLKPKEEHQILWQLNIEQ